MLEDPTLARRWLAAVEPCLRQSPPAGRDAIAAQLARPGTVLFEGAQGVLLDEWRGFHPHTSWSTVSTAAVEAVLADAGIAARVRHLGVLRSYLTRHGAGPLPRRMPRSTAWPSRTTPTPAGRAASAAASRMRCCGATRSRPWARSMGWRPAISMRSGAPAACAGATPTGWPARRSP